MSDRIERTDLANVEYRAKTGEIMRTDDRPNEDGINMRDLASAFLRASSNDNISDLEAIKKYLWSKQTWRHAQ